MLEKLNKLGLVKLPTVIVVVINQEVIVKDIVTELETEYPSIYKAARALDCSTTQIYYRNGKLLSSKYNIEIVG